jgi:hypothetical protein
MESRVVLPEPVKLDISNGDWLLVKKRLNTGETRTMIQMMHTLVDGELKFNPLMRAPAKCVAYLVDWSLVDTKGRHIQIAGESSAVVLSALDSIDPDSFVEIRLAIEAHEDARIAERTAEKKILTGETPPAAISPSHSAADGVLTGSVN